VPRSNPGSDTMSARVTLDMLLTHIVSLLRFDSHSSTYEALKLFFIPDVSIGVGKVMQLEINHDDQLKNITPGYFMNVVQSAMQIAATNSAV
jgi:hypothetical protein